MKMNRHPIQPPAASAIGSPLLWDLFCISSIIGIWPRFIEPKFLRTTELTLTLPSLPAELEGFKILQISDLHVTEKTESRFDKRLFKKIEALKPDLITLTGDLLCYSHMYNHKRLSDFLKRLKAPYGCYAALGNHDYAQSITINEDGDYDIIKKKHRSAIVRAFGRMFEETFLSKKTTDAAKNIPLHHELVELLDQTSVKLLHNTTHTIDVNGAKLNLCGLGEYTLGKLDPERAFSNYNIDAPGIVLMHNPDGIKLLADTPGDIVLSGHTHGGQVNFPWMWKKFVQLENPRLKKGLIRIHDKWLYVNRGLGSVLPFRWFAPPEILLLTLRGQP